MKFSDMDDLFDFGDQNNTLNFDSLFDYNFHTRPSSPLKYDELPPTSSNVTEDYNLTTRPSCEYSLKYDELPVPQENPLDASEIDQGLDDAARTSFDFMEFDLDEKARKDPNESSFSGVSL